MNKASVPQGNNTEFTALLPWKESENEGYKELTVNDKETFNIVHFENVFITEKTKRCFCLYKADEINFDFFVTPHQSHITARLGVSRDVIVSELG